MHVHASERLWRLQDNPQKPFLPFHPVGPRDRTQILGLVVKRLFLLNQLVHTIACFQNQ